MNKIKFIIILFGLLLFNSIKADNIKPILDGNSSSVVNILLYESLTCSHCANFHKEVLPGLKKNFIDKGLVSIQYKNFPLDLAALNASKLAHCRNDGKSNLLHYLYLNQAKWAKGKTIEEFNLNLKDTIETGGYQLDTTKCLNDESLEDHILNDRVEGVKKYNINSTPTIIINGKKFDKTLSYKNIKKAIEKLL
tara:strand:+ start:14951 stop:15532 length:582 start_codon:yes stop_codon:yes gene_type:complete